MNKTDAKTKAEIETETEEGGERFITTLWKIRNIDG